MMAKRFRPIQMMMQRPVSLKNKVEKNVFSKMFSVKNKKEKEIEFLKQISPTVYEQILYQKFYNLFLMHSFYANAPNYSNWRTCAIFKT